MKFCTCPQRGRKSVPVYPNAEAPAGFGSMTGVDYFWLERLQASAIMEACRAAKAVCIDFGGNIDYEPPKDFYDPFHTSPSGSARIAAFLYHRLQQLP